MGADLSVGTRETAYPRRIQRPEDSSLSDTGRCLRCLCLLFNRHAKQWVHRSIFPQSAFRSFASLRPSLILAALPRPFSAQQLPLRCHSTLPAPQDLFTAHTRMLCPEFFSSLALLEIHVALVFEPLSVGSGNSPKT